MIHGICIRRQAPPISNLLFADDNFLFCKAATTEANYFQDILFSYEVALGQAINFSKSTVDFSKNTSHEVSQKSLAAVNILVFLR